MQAFRQYQSQEVVETVPGNLKNTRASIEMDFYFSYKVSPIKFQSEHKTGVNLSRKCMTSLHFLLVLILNLYLHRNGSE